MVLLLPSLQGPISKIELKVVYYFEGLLSLVREATGGKFDLNLRYVSQVVALMEMNEKMKSKLR